MSITLDPAVAAPITATPDQAALLAWAETHKMDTAGLDVDGNNRYRAIPPGASEEQALTRVTTFVEALDSGGGALTRWTIARALTGLRLDDAMRKRLMALDPDDAPALNALAEAAQLRGGSKLDADIGTALHLVTEHHDLTGEVPDLPDAWRGHLDAWVAATGHHEMVHVERSGYIAEHALVGTIDRLVRLPDGRCRVLDLKTGAKVRKLTYAAQVAVYAHASHLWIGGEWVEAPEIDHETAWLAHLSATTGVCEIHTVDISRGWELAGVAAHVRANRSIKGLFGREKATEVVPTSLPEPVTEVATIGDDDLLAERTADAQRRIAIIRKDGDAPARSFLLGSWPTGVATRPPWTHPDLDAIEGHLVHLDGAEGPGWSPTAERIDVPAASYGAEVVKIDRNPETTVAGPVAADELVAAMAQLSAEARDHGAAWVAEAKRHDAPWGSFGLRMSVRTHATYMASVACLTHLYDPDDPDALTRAALAMVLGEEIQPAITTGAAVGSLDLDQAQRLADIANAFGRGETTTCADLGRIVVGA